MNSQPGGSRDIILNRKTLVDVMLQSPSPKMDDRCKHLYSYLQAVTNCPSESLPAMRHKLRHFISNFKVKWKAAAWKRERFLEKNKIWLEKNISLRVYVPRTPSNKGGRPALDFESSSERSKRRKTEALRETTNSSELVYAAQMSLRAEGNADGANVVKEIKFSTPTRAHKYRMAYREMGTRVIELSTDDALSVLVEAKLTRHQYDIIRSKDKKRFPSYKKLQEAKKRCYPDSEAITITKGSAEVKLQALLDHTIRRIAQVQEEVLVRLTTEQLNSLVLLCKWGCDGSSGQSEYKQKFDDNEDSDANIFLTSFVPLQLLCDDPYESNKIVVWQNPRTSSPRFCRPIRLQFVHETTDITVAEKNYIDNQIEHLRPTSVNLEDKVFKVSHTLTFTMIDGKVCNAVSSTTSTQKCYICGETSKSFNKIDFMLKQKAKIDPIKFSFGLSPLHARIRFFECLLHVAYKLPIQNWQARGKDKLIVAERKKRIQQEFKSKMGLIIDQPKPGFGSSNDGNTARRFFEDVEISSAITGVDSEIIERFKVILQTICCGYTINLEKFENYGITTARLFVQKYPWYNMPTTVHKILIHGREVIAAAILPIGQLSEEAQEALNKEIKKYREGYARKCSREKTLEDVFNRLLLASDPVISSLRKLPKKKTKAFSASVINLLVPPEVSITESEDSNEETSGEEESSE